jgi:glycosyltransferase involved in cell wall biosynthesis
MDEKIVASVVVPTYNRAEKAMNIIQGLEPQMTDNLELIVVIDGSKDDTFQRISSKKWSIKNLRIINQENKGRAGARNAGVIEAKGEIIIFVDDDIIVTENFLQGHIEAQKSNDVVVGALESADVSGNLEMLLFSDYLNAKWTSNLPAKDKLPYISAQNFSIKKSLFNQFNGFDNRLNDSEDLDLAFRLDAAGIEIFHSPKVIAKVPINDKFSVSLLRIKEYKKGREVLAKTDSLAGKALGETKDKVHPLKKVVFFFFSFSFWYKLVDLNFFTFLPKKVRFRLYDWMMTANMIY